jgi:N-acetylglutamate synthase-like GNAT family acetyltransferase
MELRWIEWGGDEYAAMLDLREDVLRRPLGLTLDRSALEVEKTAHLLTAWHGPHLAGCLILNLEGALARMRAVAVRETARGHGVGEQMVKELERRVREQGCTEVYAHARATVLGFYERLGYFVEGEEFIEVTIPHRVVRKHLVQEVT